MSYFGSCREKKYCISHKDNIYSFTFFTEALIANEAVVLVVAACVGLPRGWLDEDVILQNGRSQDQHFGSSLVKLPHFDGVLKGDIALIDILREQNLKKGKHNFIFLKIAFACDFAQKCPSERKMTADTSFRQSSLMSEGLISEDCIDTIPLISWILPSWSSNV